MCLVEGIILSEESQEKKLYNFTNKWNLKKQNKGTDKPKQILGTLVTESQPTAKEQDEEVVEGERLLGGITGALVVGRV